LTTIYGASLYTALNLKARTFASAYIENMGGGKFETKALPQLAQLYSVNSILIDDSDGNKDILISGNLLPS